MKTLLEKALAAVGGRERLLHLEPILIRGRIHVGEIKGTFEVAKDLASLKYRRTIDIFQFGSQEGYNDKEFWSIDANGNLKVFSDDQSVLEAKTLAAFENYAFLLSPEQYHFALSSTNNRWLLTVKNLEAADQSFGTFEVEIDKRTYRIMRLSSIQAGSTTTMTIRSYRLFRGVLFPKEYLQIDSVGNKMVLFADTISELMPVDSLFDPPLAKAEKSFEFLGGQNQGLANISIKVDHIYTEVIINGRTYNFIVDTGAGKSVIDARVASSLGLQTSGNFNAKGVGGAQSFSFATIPNIMIGNVRLRKQNIIVMDLSSLDSKLPKVDGLLGMDFFGALVVAIDYGGRSMHMFDPENFAYKGDGEKLSIFNNAILLTVDGQKGDFGIDTGSSSIDLFSSRFSSTRLMEKKALFPFISYQAGLGKSELKVYSALSHAITAGELRLKDVPVNFTNAEEGAFKDKQNSGNLGTPFWSRFITYFNFPKGELILEPGSEYLLPYTHINRAGIKVTMNRDAVLIDAVSTRSPGSEAGLEKGDIILAIDNNRAMDISIETLSELLQAPAGTTYSIAYRRAENPESKTKLVLSDYITWYDAY